MFLEKNGIFFFTTSFFSIFFRNLSGVIFYYSNWFGFKRIGLWKCIHPPALWRAWHKKKHIKYNLPQQQQKIKTKKKFCPQLFWLSRTSLSEKIFLVVILNLKKIRCIFKKVNNPLKKLVSTLSFSAFSTESTTQK